ncbi:hypothetical protein [Planomonospora parontospora]|uniref:hypothetical protein n=1 Tax=Planomonospora parontospora TaxID=58119 RepID=UPI00166F64EF|nr:hypothetical protein [Planomonospora parontospora]GGL42525.1 hypothetical protein GCM10014719_49790 [Planomonospora parontospora subsp. antibiotica]GII18382.1 hypothetical protein Ppa05_51080 [Planomonospora parontospora subsp. antibiotica]
MDDTPTGRHTAPYPAIRTAITGQPTSEPAPASSGTADPIEEVGRQVQEALAGAQRTYCVAAAEVAYQLQQRGTRLTSKQLYDASYSQALRTWWERVAEQISAQELFADHALRRVRSWARHYLTGEPAAAQPGTLFDHALAHASRAAARQFLLTSGQLLAEHATRLGPAPAQTSASTTPA